MSITSFGFGIFVAGSLFFYYKIKEEQQWTVLFISNILFFCFASENVVTIAAPIFSCISVFVATLCFEKEYHRKLALWICMAVNVLLLCAYKYSNLFIRTSNILIGTQIDIIKIVSPLAISFYTLSVISYVLNCYWGTIKRQKNIFKLFVYITFFPLMVSGPISEYDNLAPSLYAYHKADADRIKKALFRGLWGVMKKVVVADGLCVLTNLLFSRIDVFVGGWILLAAIVFSIQLYFDFSGCMDIVIAVGMAYGIDLDENFNAPFFARNTQEFWQRWHVTLGRWLRYYIMNPLLKSRCFAAMSRKLKKTRLRKLPVYLSLMVVWTLMGLWHGDSWKYIVGEGWFFGAVLIIGQLIKEPSRKVCDKLHIIEDARWWVFFRQVRTLLIFSFGMIFFRANSFIDAISRIKKIFMTADNQFAVFLLKRDFVGFANIKYRCMQLFIVVLIIIIQCILDKLRYQNKKARFYQVIQKNTVFEIVTLLIMVFGITIAGVFEQSSFIYNGF